MRDHQFVWGDILWVDIPVVDMDRAIPFYSKVLGAKVDKQGGEGGGSVAIRS
jgi:predicted enzyme related to lactoylglutathione lyase